MSANAYLATRKPDPRPGNTEIRPDPADAKFLDAFTQRNQTTTNTATNDSFNRFDTSTKTMEFGDTTLTVGAPAGGVSEYLPLILAGGIIMAGLLLFR
jgi:hypothetical protein